MATPARKFEPPHEEEPLQVVAAPARVHELFADSLVESSGRLTTSRGWTVLFSFLLQALLVGVLILLPLIFIQPLPRQQLMSFLVAPPPPPPPPAPAATEQIRSVMKAESELTDGRLRTPARIPEKIKMITESEAPPQVTTGGVVGGVPGGIPGGSLGGVLGGIIGSAPKIPEVAHAPTPTRIRVSSGVSRGLLVARVEPTYPATAKLARVQGQVVLHAIISREGTIENLRVVSGHPLLIQSALDAVKQWRYKPYLLNGEPVEVETEVLVDFRLTS